VFIGAIQFTGILTVSSLEDFNITTRCIAKQVFFFPFSFCFHQFSLLAETDRFDGDICSLPIAIGSCDDSVERWYWDQVTLSCERFSYSGCDGNENNFETRDDCSSICGGDLSEVDVTPTEVQL
jgi:Kunitz/Bovine pancreatic trypsin inhibitor domain